ncbi:DUF1499 domain-containing protein [Chryseomicrobium sp. FSL W7-1435]|uniref:DUF1499 domain-containing protein n=1 Tax=Chryseomicrobium sp. FSL W7-1435 TaxID=2921704 RepID=UPI00315AE289
MKWQVGVTLAGILVTGGMMKMWSQPRDLGAENGNLRELPMTPNAVSSQSDKEAAYIEPLPFIGSEGESVARLLKVLESTESIEVITHEPRYIHAVATTKLMKFKDDLEFAIREGEEVIHVRSGARIGISDNGVNRKRYETIRSAYMEASK